VPLDLYRRETLDRLSTMPGVETPDSSPWDGFVRGSAMYTMRGFATTARAIDLVGAVAPIVQDTFTDGTEAQDRYFKEHDEVFGNAVDYWTPKPGEVGVAGQVVGTLASTLPTVLTAPELALLSAQLGSGEELVKRGVSAEKAQLVGGVEAASLGLGIWMPILGQNLWQRALLGGAGYNLAQGLAVRSAEQQILKETPASEDYHAFDGSAITLDALLGLAFGSYAHISPAQRAHGAAAWKKIETWTKGWRVSDIDAVATLRQAEHMNVDSVPGKVVGPEDVIAHVDRLKTAIEQLARNEPVELSDHPAPNTEPDPGRVAQSQKNLEFLQAEAERIRVEEGLPKVDAFEQQQLDQITFLNHEAKTRGFENAEELFKERPEEFKQLAEQWRAGLPATTPGKQLRIPFAEELSPDQRVVEAKARGQVQADLEGQVQAYAQLPESDGGKIINTDIARELFPDYREARHIHSPSVHEPASALTKELYARALAQPDPNGLNMVTFTAGGTGAGKTTALGAVPLASHIVEASQIVYDTNLASEKSAIQKIDQGLQAGKQVNVIYVAADPIEALKRALGRATRTGRTVPLVEHAKTHEGSAATIEALIKHYEGNDHVQFVLLDNGSAGKGDVQIVEPKNVGALVKSLNFDNLSPRLKETLDAELRAGNISEGIHRGTTQSFAGGEGEAARAGGAGEPQAGPEAGARPVDEVGGAGAPPEPGRPFIVYRMGETAGAIANRNAGNADAVARHIMGTEDAMGPVSSKATKVFAYEVTLDQPFGKYEGLTGARPGAQEGPGRVVRKDEVAYSFPERGYKAKLVGSRTLEELRAQLKAKGLENFDDAGTIEGAKTIREAFATPAEAAAPRAEAQAAPPDPVAAAAQRFATENPDLMITTGQDANGDPIQKRASQVLDEARASTDQAMEDAKLFTAAAECLMGGA